MDGGQKAHVASVNDSEGHSVAVPDQLDGAHVRLTVDSRCMHQNGLPGYMEAWGGAACCIAGLIGGIPRPRV